MEQAPNKHTSFSKETPAMSADEKLAYEKLLAIKKKAAQIKILTNKTEAFKAPTTLSVKKEVKNKEPIISNNTQVVKNSLPQNTGSRNKLVQVAKIKTAIPETVKKVDTPKKIIKSSSEKNTKKQPPVAPKKRPSFLKSTPIKTEKKQVVQPIVEKSTSTPPPQETLKRPATTHRNPITTETMQALDNQISSTTYGKGQAVQVSDSPYVEELIPIEGKNLIPRSQEVHDILSYVPNWMIRWGNTVILLILGGILVMSYYIKYPDVVNGMISINSTAPPVMLVAKSRGALTLLKEDKETVAEGELIGIIKSTADYQDVLLMKEELSTFQEKLEKGWNFSYYELPTGLQLGDLQGAYSNLFIKLKEKKVQHQSTKNNQTRKQHINQQLTELEAIKKAKEQSLSIKYQEYLKAKNILDTRYRVLYDKGSISAEQMNAKESEVSNLLDRYQNDRMSFNEIKKRILDQNSNKVELDFQKADQSVLSTSSLFTAYENLKNSLYTWEETYLLKAPIAGKLNFIQFTKNNMYLQQEQVVANIIPVTNDIDSSPIMIGELLMPTLGAGKAAIGQTVNVALNDYPKKQYGIIEGRVASIADVSTLIPGGKGMTAYKVVVSFPKGLENTMKKEIQFKHNMQGQAEIITEDIRLIERFFHELRGLFDAK